MTPTKLAILFIGLGVGAAAPVMSKDLARSLIGTWRLVSTEQRMADGTVRPSPTYGPRGTGYLIYSADGRMCAMLMDPDRPRWKADDPTVEELRAGFDHFVSYCGRFEVHEEDGYVVHHVEMDLVPNNVGTELRRSVLLKGKTLKLRPAESRAGILEYTLTWERVER